MKEKATDIFDKAHSKMTESTFSLPTFVLACKKLGYFICSVLRYNFRVPRPIFDHIHQINF